MNIRKSLNEVFLTIVSKCNYIVHDLPCEIKYFFQKILRKEHVSDCDFWSLDFHLAKIIYPKLKYFRNSKRSGYPIDFSEFDNGGWRTKKEYEEEIKSGKITGGGSDEWDRTLDKILFSFAWRLSDGYVLNKKDFRWMHRQIGVILKEKREKILGDKKQKTKKLLKLATKEIDELILDWKNSNYKKYSIYNSYSRKLHRKMESIAYEYSKLFGKYFWSLWD
jgi:hypothetical protein